MKPSASPPKVILTDIDGTVINFPTFAARTFRAMTRAIVEVTGKEEEAVVEAMRAHYSVRGFENPYMTQTLRANGFFREEDCDIGDAQFTFLTKSVQHAYNQAKSSSLKPYAGMPEVLESAMQAGIPVIGLSDSDHLAISSKLNAHQARVLGPRHFSRLIVLDGRGNSHEDVDPNWHQKHVERLERRYKIPVTFTDKEKPLTDLEKFLNMSRQQIADTVSMLGDSYPRDMGLGIEYGMQSYHALWGVRDLEENIDTVSAYLGGGSPIQRPVVPEKYPKNVHGVNKPYDLFRYWDLHIPRY